MHSISPFTDDYKPHTSIISQTALLIKLSPKTIKAIAKEANVERTTVFNWRNPSCGAQIGKIEAVLHAMGYRLTIMPRRSTHEDLP